MIMGKRGWILGGLGVALACGPVWAIDAEHDARARDIAERAIAYLKSKQGPEGGWNHTTERPNLPAISGLVLTGMILDPKIDERDSAVARGLAYVAGFAKPDGGIHDGLLPSYNTAICTSLFAHVHTPEGARIAGNAVPFLKSLQYFEGYDGSPESPDFTEPVPTDHPYYGGVGYGHHGRPDLSNVGFFLQALHDAGVSSEDDAFKRAQVFLNRVQMLDEANDYAYADGSSQGGFIYATVAERDSVDGRAGQSQAGEMEETLDDGTVASRLRSYGSMTYVGFKSLIYADLKRDDPRVLAARGWIEKNFTLDENPGLGDSGRYYYYLALSRALDAWGEDEVAGQDWREGMIDELAGLQNDDGSFRSVASRWMENDPVLITAYGLIAVEVAMGHE